MTTLARIFGRNDGPWRPIVEWLDADHLRTLELSRVNGPWQWCVTARNEHGSSINVLGPTIYAATCRALRCWIPSLPNFEDPQ